MNLDGVNMMDHRFTMNQSSGKRSLANRFIKRPVYLLVLLVVSAVPSVVGCTSSEGALESDYVRLEEVLTTVSSQMKLRSLEPATKSERRTQLRPGCDCPLVSVSGERPGTVPEALEDARNAAVKAGLSEVEEFHTDPQNEQASTDGVSISGLRFLDGDTELEIDIEPVEQGVTVAIRVYEN